MEDGPWRMVRSVRYSVISYQRMRAIVMDHGGLEPDFFAKRIIALEVFLTYVVDR